MLGSVYVDFDGTIAPGDPTDTLFARFCDPSWRSIERDWQEGRRTARDCMAAQVDLLRATPEAVAALLRTMAIDPAFPGFVALCRRWRLNVVVLSDGLDLVVGEVLRAAGLKLPFFANHLRWLGGERWKLDFPFAQAGCAAALGNCKCSHRAPPAWDALSVMVGDGRSDFCIAERSHLVLAKGQLAAHCRFRKLAHQPVQDFTDASAVLGRWLANNVRKSA